MGTPSHYSYVYCLNSKAYVAKKTTITSTGIKYVKVVKDEPSVGNISIYLSPTSNGLTEATNRWWFLFNKEISHVVFYGGTFEKVGSDSRGRLYPDNTNKVIVPVGSQASFTAPRESDGLISNEFRHKTCIDFLFDGVQVKPVMFDGVLSKDMKLYPPPNIAQPGMEYDIYTTSVVAEDFTGTNG